MFWRPLLFFSSYLSLDPPATLATHASAITKSFLIRSFSIFLSYEYPSAVSMGALDVMAILALPPQLSQGQV